MMDGLDSDPVWQGQIERLFAAPYWIDATRRNVTGSRWLGCMSGYQLQLDRYDSVKQNAVLIYHYLRSREMPLTADPTEYWPDAALELLRAWVNQGCRQTTAEPIVQRQIIPPPNMPPVPLRIRKDLRSLTQQELDDYRARLDDVLDIGNANAAAPGQMFAAVHGDWCLHYQEAFLLWHRAYLMRFEQTIGCAVPYWNWFAADAAVDGSPDAGLPQAFKDLTYIHPRTGETRPNPLRFAAARLGVSKACVNRPVPGIDCRWVQRDPLLSTSGDDRRAERAKRIAMTRLFQEQVVNALAWNNFSQPQGWPGYPWANILAFDPPQPDSLYPNRTDFDGLYEQPHDNYHGWVGADMADNNFTAYDPVFWSYHANIDRIFEQWLRAHPGALYTGSFPLHPFAGVRAERFEFDDPRRFIYTTTGDLAKDSRGLGYDFAAPASPDFHGTAAERLLVDAAGEPQQQGLYVLFNGVRCTHDSYTIDAFLEQAHAAAADVDAANPHYVGRLSRIGMGIEDNKGRCITQGVTRVIDASVNALRLGLKPTSRIELTLIVTELKSGRRLSDVEWRQLPGFAPELAWGRPWPGRGAPASRSVTNPKPALPCCSPSSSFAANRSSP